MGLSGDTETSYALQWDGVIWPATATDNLYYVPVLQGIVLLLHGTPSVNMMKPSIVSPLKNKTLKLWHRNCLVVVCK